MSDGVQRGSEYEVVGQTRQGCVGVERGKNSEAVSRAGGMESETRILDCTKISQLQNGKVGWVVKTLSHTNDLFNSISQAKPTSWSAS